MLRPRRWLRFATTLSVTALIAGLVQRVVLLPPAGTQSRRWQQGTLQRTYLLRAPPGAPRALVLVLHGRGGSGRRVERRVQLDDGADAASVAVAYPDAIDGRWNDGWAPDSTNDVAFLEALADAVTAELHVDPSRVYVAGFSNGASMAHRLGCESDRFAAIAAVAGALPEPLAERCRRGRPVSVIDIHGTGDRTVYYDAHLARTLSDWVARDGCADPAEIRTAPDADPNDGTRVRIESHAQCRAGARVVLYTIEGGGHTWPGEPRLWAHEPVSRDIDASRVILGFFLDQAPLEPR